MAVTRDWLRICRECIAYRLKTEVPGSIKPYVHGILHEVPQRDLAPGRDNLVAIILSEGGELCPGPGTGRPADTLSIISQIS